MRTIRIATRASALAMIQAKTVADPLAAAGADIEYVKVSTLGDRERDRSLAAIGGDGVFVKELERALLEERADVAVHSMKDLPTEMPPELRIGAVLEREDARDVLISAGNRFAEIEDLPSGAIVGTSSLRRRAMLLMARPDLAVRELRGNVDTRVRKVVDGEYDAAIIALAGVKRLGLSGAVGGGSPLAVEAMMPAVGQGAVCAQCRAGDAAIAALLAPLNHEPSALATALERAALRRMGGGCLVPIGAHATIRDGDFALDLVVVAADGSKAVRKSARGPAASEVAAVAAAERLADDVLDAGGRELVESFRASR